MVSLWDYWRRARTPVARFDASGGSSSYAIELTRRAPKISLSAQGAASGTLRISLTWRMRANDLMGGKNHRKLNAWRHPLQLLRPAEVVGHTQGMVDVDFDLACLYELNDGSKGVVQSLGDLLGEFNGPPYLKLSGDDRFGGGSGEVLYANLDHQEEIKRLLVFVYIYDGTPAFDRADVSVTLDAGNGTHVDVPLTDPSPQARSCAVLLLEHEGGDLVARREVRYVYGFQSEIDRLYGWGMAWGRGSKPSRLRR
ncbi:Tellurium resistance [Streptomyces spiramenti]|uniref:Tellurium resistance n=1 Tax=Streptomyces spiramenti TaxID=2720606 RepID=A0ABX1AQC2_9ACTN|nr:Tellurium resistance [Streptomyces spiramenti]NJP69284.1 Tellurium resistance [Streptomyces spiramenti]